jgi:phosphoglycerate dehydrogenase-like enzyme
MLFDKPVGFIGYGAIARALQPLLMPFRCPVAAFDPWLADGYLRHSGVAPMSLEELVASSRFIFVLAVPTSENAALLDRELLERIRPESVLVVMSRAHVVDFDAMTELLSQNRFRAAVDVFPTEPLPPDHPIRDLDSVVLSAHRAGSVRDGMWDLGELVVDDLEMIARGLPPRRLQPAAPELVPRLLG